MKKKAKEKQSSRELLVPRLFRFPDEVLVRLKKYAKREKTSSSAVVREALDEFLP